MATAKTTDNEEWENVDDDWATPWEDFKKGDSVIGLFAGSKEVVPRAGGNAFLSHRIKRDDGTLIGVSGATLDARMAKLPVGARVKVTFTGTEKSARGTDMRLYDVQSAPGTKLIDPLSASQNES
jgi:hypothetical protein